MRKGEEVRGERAGEAFEQRIKIQCENVLSLNSQNVLWDHQWGRPLSFVKHHSDLEATSWANFMCIFVSLSCIIIKELSQDHLKMQKTNGEKLIPHWKWTVYWGPLNCKDSRTIYTRIKITMQLQTLATRSSAVSTLIRNKNDAQHSQLLDTKANQ